MQSFIGNVQEPKGCSQARGNLLALHQLQLFSIAKFRYSFDEGVGQFLDLVRSAAFLVFGNLLGLFHGPGLLHRLPAGVPDADTAFLDSAAYQLHQVPAAFIRKGWNGNPDERAVRGRIQAKVGLEYGLLHGRNGALVPWLHGKKSSIWYGDRSELVQGGGSAVIIDEEVFYEAGAGPTCPDRGETSDKSVYGILHLKLGFCEEIIGFRHCKTLRSGG